MTIERIKIDEKYTYQFNSATGHTQILRNGEPWLGEEPGGFPGSKAWISAANEIDELRKRVLELEGAAVVLSISNEHISSVIEDLAAIDASDPWGHGRKQALDLVLSAAPAEVGTAYNQVFQRGGWRH